MSSVPFFSLGLCRCTYLSNTLEMSQGRRETSIISLISTVSLTVQELGFQFAEDFSYDYENVLFAERRN